MFTIVYFVNRFIAVSFVQSEDQVYLFPTVEYFAKLSFSAEATLQRESNENTGQS